MPALAGLKQPGFVRSIVRLSSGDGDGAASVDDEFG